MDRRGFLKFFSAGVAGLALEQAIPLGRVWSLPKKIVIAGPGELGRAVGFDFIDEVNVGSLTPIRIPQRFDIGDIVQIPAFSPELLVVTRIIEGESVEVRDRHGAAAGIVAWNARRALVHWPTAAFPPDNSHTPS